MQKSSSCRQRLSTPVNYLKTFWSCLFFGQKIILFIEKCMEPISLKNFRVLHSQSNQLERLIIASWLIWLNNFRVEKANQVRSKSHVTVVSLTDWLILKSSRYKTLNFFCEIGSRFVPWITRCCELVCLFQNSTQKIEVVREVTVAQMDSIWKEPII